jgi:ribonuclease J
MNPSDLVLLCTGSQGELRSALYKIARGEDNFFRFDDKDVVLFSSKVIPGNEVEIRNLQNMLVENGVEILTSDIEKNLHVSGHPGKKSVLQMYKWIKPKSLIPVHGDQWMLLSHKKFAKDSGLEEVRIPKIGEVISCKRSGGKASLEVINTVDATYFAVDGVSIVPFSSPSLRDRSLVAENGLVSLSVVSRESKSKTKVDIGVAIIGIPLSVEMYAKMEGLVKDTVNEALSSGPSVSDFTAPKIKKLVAKLFDINCRRRPVVVFHMLHV